MSEEIKIPKGWEIKKLGEIADLNPRESLYRGKVYPYIDMSSVPENNRLPERFLYKEYKGSGSKFRKGDVLFARITPCLENGKTVFVKDFPQDEVGFGSTEFIIIRQKKGVSDALFLYYLSRWNTFREIAKKKMSGTSGRQRVSAQALANINVPCPPLPEQQKIAEILASFDDQIENLMEQNKTLEEIAKTIFKRWFIDFEFPNEEGKPYKSSGGEFVDSEIGEIPKDWEIVYLKDEFKFERGVEPGSKYYIKNPSEKQIKQNGLIPFYRVKDLETKSNVYILRDVSKNKLSKYGDVLVSFDGTVGRVSAFLEGCYSSGIRKISSHKYPNAFIYFLMKSEYIQNIIKKHATGTTILHASKSIEYLYFLRDKESKILKRYIKVIQPIFERILNNITQIQTLTQLRDTLLPKLITGQIRVEV